RAGRRRDLETGARGSGTAPGRGDEIARTRSRRRAACQGDQRVRRALGVQRDAAAARAAGGTGAHRFQPMRNVRRIVALIGAASLCAAPAYAHHEAIFGPQSSAVLSPGTFLSAQVFDRETGRDDDKGRETTAVFSVGFRPSKHPLSIAVVVPFTFSS